MKFRIGLLLGAAFLTGVVAGPTLHRLGPALNIHAARAEDTPADRDDAYHALTLFGSVFEKVRADYVEPVKDQTLIENALDGMLSGLDPHSSYMNPKQWADMQITTKGEFGGLGLEVTADDGLIKVISPIDDTPAARAGMKTGDLILSLDHKSVEGLSLNDAVDKMRGPKGTTITLTVKREHVDKPIEVTMTREEIHIQVVKSAEYGDIGYIRLSSFNEESDPKLREAIDKIKADEKGNLRGLILDLRNNPGGLLDQAVDICSDFISDGEIVSTRARHEDESQRWDAKGTDLLDGLPLVVLINGGSASASEIVAGALQDHRRAVILGTRSFGKGSVQTVIPLGNDGAMRLTTARYYTPSGRSIQGLGIAPDVQVAETRDDEMHFLPDREADLNHALKNEGGSEPTKPAASRDDLPPEAKNIPSKPPTNWPKFDPTKPDTDFQLQQGIALAQDMAQQRHAAR
ncbi:MAG TPA: S41 family peptidase [Acetobacteraceae bacterium]|nr:S41 family peptidase [Acetobacteraceae bacterium]